MPLAPAVEPHPARPLAGRVVLVTGGAQGIGRGIAQAVLGAGGAVVIADADAAAGHACLDEWDVDAAAMFVRTDVAREGAVRRFVDRALAAYGRIDGLVNNAAVVDPEAGRLDDLALADWNRYIAAGLTSVFLCTRAAAPALRASGGAIVNIASTRAHQSEPGTEPYAAVKGGVVALTHALAVSLGPEVRVNCISPGWVPTDAWRRPAARRAPKLSRRDHAQHPAGRAGTPQDIGALAVHLLSPQAGFITGAEFVVDGGMSRRMRYD